MHGDRAIAVVEPWSLRTWLALGAVGVLGPLAFTLPATGAADVLMVGLAAASAGGTWWAVRIRRWLDALPLEIAPIAGTGVVDGVRVWRFRARLGRGRLVLDPSASVERVAPDGTVVPLEVEVPGGRLCGPFTILAREARPGHAPTGDFRVVVRTRSASGEVRAERTIAASCVHEGRFGGISAGTGRVRFEEDWASIEATT